MELVTSGSELPKLASVTAGNSLIKIVPEGQAVSPYSPFFTTKDEFMKVSSSTITLADAFGLPKVSESPRYSIYQIEAKANTNLFVSPVAPTVESYIQRQGGAMQSIVPNRKLWSTPELIGNSSN